MLVTKVQMNFKYKHRAHAYVSSPALQIQEMKNHQTEKERMAGTRRPQSDPHIRDRDSH